MCGRGEVVIFLALFFSPTTLQNMFDSNKHTSVRNSEAVALKRNVAYLTFGEERGGIVTFGTTQP